MPGHPGNPPGRAPLGGGRPAAGDSRPPAYLPGKAPVGGPLPVDGRPRRDAAPLDATRLDTPAVRDADQTTMLSGTRQGPPVPPSARPGVVPGRVNRPEAPSETVKVSFTAADVAANRRRQAAAEHERSLAEATARFSRVDEPSAQATTVMPMGAPVAAAEPAAGVKSSAAGRSVAPGAKRAGTGAAAAADSRAEAGNRAETVAEAADGTGSDTGTANTTGPGTNTTSATGPSATGPGTGTTSATGPGTAKPSAGTTSTAGSSGGRTSTDTAGDSEAGDVGSSIDTASAAGSSADTESAVDSRADTASTPGSNAGRTDAAEASAATTHAAEPSDGNTDAADSNSDTAATVGPNDDTASAVASNTDTTSTDKADDSERPADKTTATAPPAEAETTTGSPGTAEADEPNSTESARDKTDATGAADPGAAEPDAGEANPTGTAGDAASRTGEDSSRSEAFADDGLDRYAGPEGAALPAEPTSVLAPHRPTADATMVVRPDAEQTRLVAAAPSLPAVNRSTRPAWTPIERNPGPRRGGVTVFGTTLTGRQAAVGVAIVATFVLLVGLLIAQAFGGDKEEAAAGPQASATAPGKTSGAAKPSSGKSPAGAAPSKPGSVSTGLPDGWRTYQGSGFSVPVPKNATTRNDGKALTLEWSNRNIRIDALDSPLGDPVKFLEEQQTDHYRSYRPIGITPVDYHGRAADWEFTYQTNSGHQYHVVRRAFALNGKTYMLSWYTPEADWAKVRPELETIYRGFGPK